MAREFKKLSEVSALEAISDGTTVLVVEDGEVKQTIVDNIVVDSGLPEVTSTNQQLVTDADGNITWEERLGYKDWDYVEQTDVPVGIYTLGYGSLPFEFFPVEGEEYTVTLDGTAYTCSATIITIDDENVTVVGSTTFFGGTVDPDIPVAICCRSGRATVYANESGDHTIGITGYVKNPKKISREYIDWNPVVGVIDSHYYNYRYLNESRGASIAEIRKAAADKNKDIIIRLDLDTWQGTMRYLGLVNVSTDGSTYKSALLFSTIKSENASINISDETIDGNMQLEYWYTFLEPAESLEANAFIGCQFGKVDLTDVALKSDVDQSITQLSEEKLNKNFGAENAGAKLVVGSDGDVTAQKNAVVTYRPELEGIWNAHTNQIATSADYWYFRTDLLSLAGVTKIKASFKMGNSGYGVAFFNDAQNIMPSVSIIGESAGSYKVVEMDVPAGAAYCVLSHYGGAKSDPANIEDAYITLYSGDGEEAMGITKEQISALNEMFKVCAYVASAESAYAAFCAAFGIEGA